MVDKRADSVPCALGIDLIYTGMVEKICAEWEDSYFDACLCDPPYLLQFMGKEFDKQHKKEKGVNEGQKMQAWHERWAREVLRVLKPGAHMLAFGGTRTYHRLVCAAEDIGFEVKDMLTWLYGSGFPKGQNLKPAVEPCVLARKKGTKQPLDLDSTRIMTADVQEERRRHGGGIEANHSTYFLPDQKNIIPPGRWPANLILDEESAAMLDEQSRVSASRFFYTSKVSPRERHLGGITCDHPTLKPISLTTYLSRLLLPPARADHSPRRLLVPFSGAGSEIIGALLAGWDQVIGIEMDAEYVSWARERIKAVRNGEFKS